MSRNKKWLLRYFPHTNQCGHDGKECLQVKCKCWLGEKKCWDRMFDELVEETFNTKYGRDYIYFKDETGHHIEGIRHIHFNLYANDRDKFEEPIVVTAEIGFNSRRLTEKVQEKFQLIDWEIDSQCQDGGDDHALVLHINGNYENKNKILDLFNFILDLIPKIVLFESKTNTCAACGDKSENLTEYPEGAICGGCEKKIIQENIEKYIKK